MVLDFHYEFFSYVYEYANRIFVAVAPLSD